MMDNTISLRLERLGNIHSELMLRNARITRVVCKTGVALRIEITFSKLSWAEMREIRFLKTIVGFNVDGCEDLSLRFMAIMEYTRTPVVLYEVVAGPLATDRLVSLADRGWLAISHAATCGE